jgi:hypothetical protein
MPRATLTLLLAPLAACGLAPGEASDPAATAGSTGEATQSASAHPTTTADHDPTTTGHESTAHATAAQETTAAPACDPTPVGPAAADPYSFMVDDQLAWSHDSGHPAGWFHTYDAFDRGAPEHSPHKIHVLLPRGHDPCGAPYPLIVMNDGDTSFWPGGAGNKTWDVAGALAQLYDEGALPPVVVVAIVPNDREYEYSHAPAKPGAPCCGVESYTRYVADQVLPFIAAHYNTGAAPGDPTPVPARTAIIGSSRGGLAAFYVANSRPEVFGRAGCLSPSFWVGLDPVYGGELPGGPLADAPLITAHADVLVDPTRRPRLWIDWGLVRTGGFHNEVIEAAATERGREMVELLQATFAFEVGQDLHWYEDPLGEHDEVTWARHLPEALPALFSP